MIVEVGDVFEECVRAINLVQSRDIAPAEGVARLIVLVLAIVFRDQAVGRVAQQSDVFHLRIRLGQLWNGRARGLFRDPDVKRNCFGGAEIWHARAWRSLEKSADTPCNSH